MVTLKEGTILGRIGNKRGRYVAPPEMLALRPGTDISTYKEYRVVKDISGVQQAKIAAWFDMPGGGLQYELPYSIEKLLRDGYIECITK